VNDEERSAAISIAETLEKLKDQHANLEVRIKALELQGDADFEVMTLKRQKLVLKEQIEKIANSSLPDIIA
jgi:hypothetical protein